jgi:hypothetical protein
MHPSHDTPKGKKWPFALSREVVDLYPSGTFLAFADFFRLVYTGEK